MGQILDKAPPPSFMQEKKGYCEEEFYLKAGDEYFSVCPTNEFRWHLESCVEDATTFVMKNNVFHYRNIIRGTNVPLLDINLVFGVEGKEYFYAQCRETRLYFCVHKDTKQFYWNAIDDINFIKVIVEYHSAKPLLK
jgi:hypothetical protein